MVSNTRQSFQSTRPRRARLGKDPDVVACIHVSIHAPAEGATPGLAVMAPWSTCFNPRARGGRDNCQSPRETERMLFQSTRPRRARRRQGSMCTYRSRCFNPRARGGRDTPDSPMKSCDGGFNPRARGGRDPHGHAARCGWHCFNPRARGGRDAQKALDKRINTRFQSTRPRRARRVLRRFIPADAGFQSTRPRRARQKGRCGPSNGYSVSIHAPAEGAT